MDISTIIDDMVEYAVKEYETRKEEIELEHEKVLSTLQDEYESSKYNSLQSYYNIIYSEIDHTTDEYKIMMKQYPLFPDQFLEQLCKNEIQHKKEVERVEMKYVHTIDSLEMKYAETMRQLQRLRDTVSLPHTTSSWFSVFDSDDSDKEEDNKEK